LSVLPAHSRNLDDTILEAVLRLLRHIQGSVEELDSMADRIESHRRRWLRLEVIGRLEANEDALALSHAVHEISWFSHTLVSKLILLSTLRDNNTGMYHHPALSRRFSTSVVNNALARIHTQTCDELLKRPFAEIVDELEVYANQTRSGRHRLLGSWKSIRAYRSARPAELDAFSSLCFELTFDLALAALDSRSS
jgi:hypothetical protein